MSTLFTNNSTPLSQNTFNKLIATRQQTFDASQKYYARKNIGAAPLETGGRGSKYLSDKGTYSCPANRIIFAHNIVITHDFTGYPSMIVFTVFSDYPNAFESISDMMSCLNYDKWIPANGYLNGQNAIVLGIELRSGFNSLEQVTSSMNGGRYYQTIFEDNILSFEDCVF